MIFPSLAAVARWAAGAVGCKCLWTLWKWRCAFRSLFPNGCRTRGAPLYASRLPCCCTALACCPAVLQAKKAKVVGATKFAATTLAACPILERIAEGTAMQELVVNKLHPEDKPG